MNTKKIFYGILALACLFAGFRVVYSFYLSQQTGVLMLAASNDKAALTVAQQGHQPHTIGTGKANVRLNPGSYEIFASIDRQQVSSSVEIKKGQTNNQFLNFSAVQKKQALIGIESANTLIKLLPYTGPKNAFRVDYKYRFTPAIAQPVIIVISPNAAGKAAALAWIKQFGFSPTDFEVEYYTAAVQ